MIDPLTSASRIAGSGLEAQSTRMRIIAENLANANATGDAAGADPYRRKTVTFDSEIDRASGASLVTVDGVGADRAPFRTEYDPAHPAADADGYVKLPNVNMLVEMSDMREANRAYEANLAVVRQTRSMVAATIDLLRSQ